VKLLDEIKNFFYSAEPHYQVDNSLNQNRAALDLSDSFDSNAKRIFKEIYTLIFFSACYLNSGGNLKTCWKNYSSGV
jgi:hypothetical protein